MREYKIWFELNGAITIAAESEEEAKRAYEEMSYDELLQNADEINESCSIFCDDEEPIGCYTMETSKGKMVGYEEPVEEDEHIKQWLKIQEEIEAEKNKEE